MRGGGGGGGVRFRSDTKSEGGGGEGGAVRFRPDTESGGVGGVWGCVLSALGPTRKAGGLPATGPIQKAGKGRGGGGGGGLFSRRGSGTLFERGGCNPPQTPLLDPPLTQQFGRPHAGDYKLRVQTCIRAYHKACTHD